MPEEVHFHLVYVGGGNFQLTLTHMRKPSSPIIEQMTLNQLRQCIRGMKPGSLTIKFVKARIDCNASLDQMRAYFKQVLDCHEECLARGENPDARLEEMRRNIDPIDGSGSWLN